MMSKEAVAAKKAYMKSWRENNKPKIKAAQNRYWERVAAKEVQAK